jgi:hypothetical protein
MIRRNARSIAVLAVVLGLVSGGRCPAADIEFPWRREGPNPKVVAEQIRAMVARLVASGAVTVPPATGHTDAFHYRIIRGYAMIQALPYLASFSYIDDDGTTKTLPASPHFAAAKLFATDTFAILREKGHALSLPGGGLDGASAEKVRVDLLGATADWQRTNYTIPLVLAIFDAAYTGGLDVEETGFSRSKDRRARAAERPPAEGQRAVARLAALVLARNRNDFGNDATKPVALKHWSYDECASIGADMSVTGLAPLALRAAVNLDLLSYDDPAFDFPFIDGGSPLKREPYKARLADVLVHMVITLAEAGEKHSSASEVSADWTDRVDGAPGGVVDVRRYRSDPMNLPSGVPIRRVVELSGPKLPEADSVGSTLFYYGAAIDKKTSGAYFCANAAYASSTCANLLVALLERSPGATLGLACPIKPDPTSPWTWNVAVAAGEYELKLANPYRYTRLVVRHKGGADLRLDDRIARMFNMVVRMMAEPGGAPASYYKMRPNPPHKLSDARHDTWTGLHWFGVMKACVATKQHAYDLGPWPWYDALIVDVVTPGVAQFKIEEGTLDFMIIAASHSYRSAFSREK